MEEKIKTGEFVMPGDFLGTAEEFIPGPGAYEEGGKVYSSATGAVLLDTTHKQASVSSNVPEPPVLKKGDIVIGSVEDVREQSANVQIAMSRGNEGRALPLPDYGTIHISQTRGSYVRQLSTEFKVGDIVRAKVLDVAREPIRLSTSDSDLGVIFAACSNCRSPLELEGNKLRCPNCGNLESRKLAKDYRTGVL
jgi:exosome complex component CSL4